jgi:hypothetical protein
LIAPAESSQHVSAGPIRFGAMAAAKLILQKKGLAPETIENIRAFAGIMTYRELHAERTKLRALCLKMASCMAEAVFNECTSDIEGFCRDELKLGPDLDNALIQTLELQAKRMPSCTPPRRKTVLRARPFRFGAMAAAKLILQKKGLAPETIEIIRSFAGIMTYRELHAERTKLRALWMKMASCMAQAVFDDCTGVIKSFCENELKLGPDLDDALWADLVENKEEWDEHNSGMYDVAEFRKYLECRVLDDYLNRMD